jgi:hypothetical protein
MKLPDSCSFAIISEGNKSGLALEDNTSVVVWVYRCNGSSVSIQVHRMVPRLELPMTEGCGRRRHVGAGDQARLRTLTHVVCERKQRSALPPDAPPTTCVLSSNAGGVDPAAWPELGDMLHALALETPQPAPEQEQEPTTTCTAVCLGIL